MATDKNKAFELLREVHFPVVVCKNEAGFPVEYMNLKAEIYFSPERSIQSVAEPAAILPLEALFPTQFAGRVASLIETVQKTNQVNGWEWSLKPEEGANADFVVYGNLFSMDATQDHAVILFLPFGHDASHDPFTTQFLEVVNIILYDEDTEQAIDRVIATAGGIIDASRVYIFEEISKTVTRNTYEWCAPGIDPAIQDLQHLEKSDYNYDVIVSAGLYIANDVSKLPENDRVILESQGIRALAIIALNLEGNPIGYVGFDDCNHPRSWNHDEIRFLQNISHILVSLIRRRNAESGAKQNASLLQLVSDISDDVIYVRDFEDYSILMVNRKLADTLGVAPEDLIGKKCWEVLWYGMEGPCDFCPGKHLEIKPGEERSEKYEWEHLNPTNGRIYWVKDVLSRWNNGRVVHVENASDITERKDYEKNLTLLASTDIMTGIHNREWGAQVLRKKLDAGERGQLCFIDLDGLKKVNDTLGHKAGDDMLIGTVRMLQAHITSEDYICRWGGDEFLVWTQGDRARADSIMAAVRADMHAHNAAENARFSLSFSYGVIDFEGGNFDALISKADAMMYERKMKQRGLLQRRRHDDPIDDRMI